MRELLVLSLLLFLTVVKNSYGKIDRTLFLRDGDMLVLDDWNHKNVVRNVKFIFTLCYERGRDGRHAMEEFMNAKKQLINECEDLDFARVDLTKNSKFRNSFPLSTLPCIRLFKNQKYFDYHGEITTKHIVSWAHRAMNMPLDIKLAHELDELKKTTSVILGVFPNKSPEEEYRTFVEASEHYVYDPKLDLPRFAVVTNSRLIRTLGLSPGDVVIYKKFEGGEKVKYGGSGKDLKALNKFCEEESYPYVFSHDFKGVHNKVNSLHAKYRHVLFISPKDRNYKSTFDNFKQAARTYFAKNRDVLFVISDPAEVPEDTLTGYFHIDTSKDLPCNRIIVLDRFNSKFPPDRPDFSARGFIQFTDDVLNEKIERTVKSEVQPSDWDSKAVKYLVGTTYESYLHQNIEKAVFILYYGAEHKQSKEIIPEFEKAAMNMKNNQTTIFAKLDVVRNDGELGCTLNYPSMVLHFPGGTRTKKYNGHKFTAEAYEKFIKTGGLSTPPDAYEKMMHEIAEDALKMEAKLEAEMIKEEEEREKEWAKEEEEALKHSIFKEVGQTMDELPENIKYDREHADNPLEHNPEEHVEAALGDHYHHFGHIGL